MLHTCVYVHIYVHVYLLVLTIIHILTKIKIKYSNLYNLYQINIHNYSKLQVIE